MVLLNNSVRISVSPRQFDRRMAKIIENSYINAPRMVEKQHFRLGLRPLIQPAYQPLSYPPTSSIIQKPQKLQILNSREIRLAGNHSRTKSTYFAY